MRSIHILIILLIVACLAVLLGIVAMLLHWGPSVAYPLTITGLVTALSCSVLLVRHFWKGRAR